MTTRLIPVLCLSFAVGCLPDSKSVGEGESSGGGTESGTEGETNASSSAGTSASSASMSGTSAGTTTSEETSGSATSVGSVSMSGSSGVAESGSTGDLCEPEDCLCEEGTVPVTGCEDGEFFCECVPSACPFEETVCEMVEGGKVLPEDVIDCGTVTLIDDAAAWQAAHTCAMEAFAISAAYKVFAQQQGIDSQVWRALGGLVGFVYQPVEYFYDGGGFDASERISMRTCTPVVLDDCVPGPGNLCIDCVGEEKPQEICFAPGM